MLEFTNIQVYNLKESIIACRYAMKTKMPEMTEEEFQAALPRARALAKAGGGSGHTSFRKGILVSFDMKYTQYITKQFQRYHWFEYVTSSSLMHRITKMNFDECCNKYVTPESKTQMKALILAHRENPTYENFMKVISNCPMGVELFVRITTSYEQLATIYRQRLHHKLKEDYGSFVDMVKSLPYSELIITEKNDK